MARTQNLTPRITQQSCAGMTAVQIDEVVRRWEVPLQDPEAAAESAMRAELAIRTSWLSDLIDGHRTLA